MELYSNIDSDLLALFVAGEADAAQRAAVEQWVAAAPANALELQRLRAAWSMAEGAGDGPDVDVDAAWQRVAARMDAAKVIPLRPSRSSAWKWMAAAAAVVGTFFLVRVLMGGPESQQLASGNDFMKAALADSSTVTLSPGSRLVADMGDERHVELTGQAYFEVKRDEARPFVVDAGGMSVTVLGTAFEVTHRDGNDTVTVRVHHGKVGVAHYGVEAVVLAAGEKAQWVKGELLVRSAIGPVERWADRIIQFNNAPLQQVVEELNAAYGVRIELGNEAILGCPLTATFGNEPVDQVVHVIANTFGFEVVSNGPEGWTINGEGC
ncbi:MAG: FecR domain-containing protein [Flavobacteriales bacterium]|nr:MAG: FecR domain-containing protein [Flavobacteriales bacterium]